MDFRAHLPAPGGRHAGRDVDPGVRLLYDGHDVGADGLLLEWENITENGKELICTRENRIRVLKIAAPIRDFLAQAAQDYTTFEKEDEEEDSATFRGDGGMEPEVGEDDGPPSKQDRGRGPSGTKRTA